MDKVAKVLVDDVGLVPAQEVLDPVAAVQDLGLWREHKQEDVDEFGYEEVGEAFAFAKLEARGARQRGES